MASYAHVERVLTDALDLTRRPVAIAFRDSAPAAVEKFTGTLPSSCSFWPIAAAGRSFYTVPSDHYNCPIGSFTHNIPLPLEREQELPQALSLMAQIGYIRMEEVPAIPRLPSTPGVVIYAPLADAPVDPDVVILSGRPGRLMLLHEASARAGEGAAPLYGRPTCMSIPAALTQSLVSSLGCIGNRTYTELPDEELYTTIAGKALASITAELATISAANMALTDHHRTRRAALTRQG
jgi:uncharacterized protein (DUF169 family)